MMALSADVLIVSGGSAGVMVAIRAKQMGPGQRGVVFEKRDMRHSGGIARGMDAVVIVLLLPFTYYLGPSPASPCSWAFPKAAILTAPFPHLVQHTGDAPGHVHRLRQSSPGLAVHRLDGRCHLSVIAKIKKAASRVVE